VANHTTNPALICPGGVCHGTPDPVHKLKADFLTWFQLTHASDGGDW